MEGKGKSSAPAAAAAAASAPSYVEFEPFCEWQREESRDALVIHLPEFKKEQLRVQINNRGILKISGERYVDSMKKSKFYKEVEVPKYCDTNGIQAKFASSRLYVIMPKIPKVSTEETNKTAADGSGVVADDNQKKKSEATQAPATVEKAAPAPAPAQAQAKDAGLISKKETQPFPNTVQSSSADPKDVTTTKPKGSAVSRMKICAKTTLNVAVAVAVLAALTSFVLYMYRSVVVED